MTHTNRSERRRRLPGLRWAASAGLLLVLAGAMGCAAHSAKPDLPAELPATMVWAWERPEDLRFLPPTTGVAFLASTVMVTSAGIAEHARAYPVKIAENAPRIAVVRIESDGSSLTPAAQAAIASVVSRAASLDRVQGVQIDFDARSSERGWYREFLQQVRHQLPAGRSLSITALASWCEGDNWIAGLPVDEAVPMIFRLGPERQSFRQMAASGHLFREPLCRSSVGLSADEYLNYSGHRRIYWFSPVPWTPELYRRIGAHR